MPIELKMPALSPTMEEGTLAKWLVKEGDEVKSGDILAEIETDKATMEFEAVDEGKIAKILVPEGSEGVKVGAPIAILAGEGEDASKRPLLLRRRTPQRLLLPRLLPRPGPTKRRKRLRLRRRSKLRRAPQRSGCAAPRRGRPHQGLAARPPPRAGAEHRSVHAPGQRSRRPDRSHRRRRRGRQSARRCSSSGSRRASAAPALGTHLVMPGPIEQAIPHEAVKLSNIRKTIARRLTEAKQQVPHIYLTVDIQLDALLKLRTELNAGLESRGVKLSVNDLLIKALAQSLIEVPECNVAFAGDQMLKYSRADISVAVSIPAGPDHADHRRRRSQERVGDLDRDEGARRPCPRRQAPAAAISGRHRVHLEHGHVRDQAVRGGHQPAAGHDHGHRRGREAPLRHQ